MIAQQDCWYESLFRTTRYFARKKIEITGDTIGQKKNENKKYLCERGTIVLLENTNSVWSFKAQRISIFAINVSFLLFAIFSSIDLHSHRRRCDGEFLIKLYYIIST